MKTRFTLITSIFVVGSVLFTGCNVLQSDHNEPAMATVEFKALTGQNAGKTSATHFGTTMSGHVELEEIKLYVDRIQMVHSVDDTLNFRIRNSILTLPLDGSPLVVSESEIPVGVYKRFQFKIGNPMNPRSPRAPQISDPDFIGNNKNYSVVVKGTYEGQPFEFKSDKVFVFNYKMDPPMMVTDSESIALNIAIDVEKWFVSRQGVALDPTNQRDHKWIEQNIRSSFMTLNRHFFAGDESNGDENGNGSDSNGSNGNNGNDSNGDEEDDESDESDENDSDDENENDSDDESDDDEDDDDD